MAIPVTYSLTPVLRNSNAYYQRIREFTDEVIKRASESLKTSIKEFKEYIRTSRPNPMRKPPYLLLLLPVILLLSPSCHKETEEDKVRKVITAVQKSAEEKKIMSVLEHVSKTYQDPQGNNYDGIRGLLAFYFFQHQKVSVFIPDIEIVVTGPTAKATFQAILTGRGTGEAAATAILPEALGAYNFEVHFKQEEGRWKATSAKWERAGE